MLNDQFWGEYETLRDIESAKTELKNRTFNDAPAGSGTAGYTSNLVLTVYSDIAFRMEANGIDFTIYGVGSPKTVTLSTGGSSIDRTEALPNDLIGKWCFSNSYFHLEYSGTYNCGTTNYINGVSSVKSDTASQVVYFRSGTTVHVTKTYQSSAAYFQFEYTPFAAIEQLGRNVRSISRINRYLMNRTPAGSGGIIFQDGVLKNALTYGVIEYVGTGEYMLRIDFPVVPLFVGIYSKAKDGTLMPACNNTTFIGLYPYGPAIINMITSSGAVAFNIATDGKRMKFLSQSTSNTGYNVGNTVNNNGQLYRVIYIA